MTKTRNSQQRQRVRVDLAGHGYDVVVGPGAIKSLGASTRKALGKDAKRALVVVDDKLPDATVQQATESLAGYGLEVSSAYMHATETNKRLETVEQLHHKALGAGLSRNDVVVALGGGIVGDVGGFLAASYKRGIRVVQAPTTLLSMVDASVGGKAGVNLAGAPDGTGGLLKNMVGAFWQPVLVCCDTETLRSLEVRHRVAGLAECIKHAILASKTDPDFFGWMTESARAARFAAGELSTDATELVARNVAIKTAVIADDEREERFDPDNPGRVVLNLGHTFGHALEGQLGSQPADGAFKGGDGLLHGEAVAAGICAAGACAVQLGMMPQEKALRIRDAVGRLGLPTLVQGIPADNVQLLSRAGHDKKHDGVTWRLPLPSVDSANRVRVRLVENPSKEAVESGFNAVRQA